jgi:catechol 2,3-dioxygenase-like lactoylglutathione lyase family enzyme
VLGESKAYSGFAAPDLKAARSFYEDTLGVPVTVLDEENLLQLDLAGGRQTLIYVKPDHEPANFTILNFPVADIAATVKELNSRGVEFERYEGFEQDEDGIAWSKGQGPDIAWFKDPAGNILSVHSA